MPYGRIANRIPNVSPPPNGKAFIDRTIDATLPTGNPQRVQIAFGLTLFTIVLSPGKIFPLHLREAYNRAYEWLKMNSFPLQPDGSCVVMSTAGIYAGALALKSPVEPDFITSANIEAEMDDYGIAITIGSEVVDYYGAGSAPVRTAITENLDFGKNAAGHF